jgi:hypothetical protein
LPGVLGDLLGWFEREWLVSITGSMKKGKSSYAWEFVYHALTAGLKVAWYSLEMNKKTVKKKIYKRLTAMADQGGEYAYPIFDCKYNQDNSCMLAGRKNKIKLAMNDAGDPEPYDKDSKYRICTFCRENKEFRKGYVPAIWWATQYQEKALDAETIKKKTKLFKKLYGNNLRCRVYPAFAASMGDLLSDYDVLEDTEGFVADVILVDMVDITAAEDSDALEDENKKWKLAKNFAGVKKCLFINCNQGNRQSINAKTLKQNQTGGNIKKLAHLDVDITLNQTEKEKKQGIMRMEVLLHRLDESTEKGQVIVLQQLKLGQMFLDSEWNRKDKED